MPLLAQLGHTSTAPNIYSFNSAHSPHKKSAHLTNRPTSAPPFYSFSQSNNSPSNNLPTNAAHPHLPRRAKLYLPQNRTHKSAIFPRHCHSKPYCQQAPTGACPCPAGQNLSATPPLPLSPSSLSLKRTIHTQPISKQATLAVACPCPVRAFISTPPPPRSRA